MDWHDDKDRRRTTFSSYSPTLCPNVIAPGQEDALPGGFIFFLSFFPFFKKILNKYNMT